MDLDLAHNLLGIAKNTGIKVNNLRSSWGEGEGGGEWVSPA
jgi:hypothetical protein